MRNNIMKINLKGFTIIELTVVVAVIGIMTTIGIVAYSDVQMRSRNDSRSSKVYVLAEALEKYYNKNGEYPLCASIASPVTADTVVTNILKGLDPDVLRTPSAAKGTNSVACSDPTSDTYGYIVSGSGAEFTLKYKEEGTSNLPSRDSRHRISSGIYTLTLNAGTGGTVNEGGSYASGQTPTITATPAQYYQFSSWTGSSGCAGTASHTIVMDANKTCTANFVPIPINPPSPPVVAANTVGATTTWSWGASSCGTNTARYQYRYTISPSGYDSGWVTTASTSVALTTSTDGQTYRVTVQAECYNPIISSGYSDPDDYEDYYRPIPYCTLTVNSAGNGTVSSSSGTYDCGTSPDTPTITAYPNTYYYFSGWTGSGCTGGGSNPAVITMTGNITCTANFAATPVGISGPYVSYSYYHGFYTYFPYSFGCTGPATNWQVRWEAYDDSTGGKLAGWIDPGGSSGTIAASTMYTARHSYHVRVWAVCWNPVTSSGDAYGYAYFYRDVWWVRYRHAWAPNYVYYADDGTQRRYKTTNTANASPQSSGGQLVSPQANPTVDFSLYPAQNNCKAIGGRTPTQNEITGVWYDVDSDPWAYGPRSIPAAWVRNESYRTNTQLADDKTHAINRRYSGGGGYQTVSLKTNSNPVRCVRD